MKRSTENRKRLIIVEDSAGYIETLTRKIAETEWVIHAVATNTTAALELLEQIQRDAVSIAVAIIDGTLGDSGKMSSQARYDAEGGRVAAEIKRLYPDLPVIGFSGDVEKQRRDKNVNYVTGKEFKKVLAALEFYERKLGL